MSLYFILLFLVHEIGTRMAKLTMFMFSGAIPIDIPCAENLSCETRNRWVVVCEVENKAFLLCVTFFHLSSALSVLGKSHPFWVILCYGLLLFGLNILIKSVRLRSIGRALLLMSLYSMSIIGNWWDKSCKNQTLDSNLSIIILLLFDVCYWLIFLKKEMYVSGYKALVSSSISLRWWFCVVFHW